MTIYVSASINGTTYRDLPLINVKSRISDTSASSSFTIELDNRDGLYSSTFDVANEVIIKSDDGVNPPATTILVGRVSDVSHDSSPNWETVTLTGKDYTTVLQDFTVEPEVYNNQEVSVIVIDLITKYTVGITTNNVQITAKTLPRQVFLQKNVYDAIKELAEFAGYYFFVDNNKDLNFVPQSTVDSGLTFDNSNTTDANFERTDDELVNRIYVYGNRILTAHTQTLTGDGGSIFTLSYKPHNTTVKISGTTILSGGIFEMVDPDSNPWQYLVDFDNKNIIFTSGTVAGDNLISSGGSFIIDYFRDVPIVKVADGIPSQESYGVRTKVIISEEIRDPRQAIEVANNQLLQLQDPIFEANVSLKGVLAITPGQLATLVYPNQNVNAKYTILEANYIFDKDTTETNTVLKVKLSSKRRDILDTLKQIILDLKKQQASQINVDDVITRIKTTAACVSGLINWYVWTNDIGNSFILGHPVNGFLGSVYNGINGSQILLGAQGGGSTIVYSGIQC